MELEINLTESRSQMNRPTTIRREKSQPVPSANSRHRVSIPFMIVGALILINSYFDIQREHHEARSHSSHGVPAARYHGLVLLAGGHIVLTKDDHGQSLVLTGDDGKGGGKGKGKGGGGGDRLVIAGNGMGGGGGGNMVMQDAANREGDVVINGNSMIIPGEDGHIVLADNRNDRAERRAPPPPNLFAFWLPYLNNRMFYNNPYFGAQFG